MSFLGHIPDRFRPHWPKHGLAAGSNAPDADLSQHVVAVLDQQRENSCTANAIGQAVRMRWDIEGLDDAPLLSRRALYWESRAADGLQSQDDGARPAACFDALDQYGFCLEASCPYDDSLVLHPPPPGIYRASFDESRTVAYERLPEGGVARTAAIRQAIAAGYPCTVALQITDVFEAGTVAVWEGDGKVIGGHYLCIVATRVDAALVVNSWSRSWGVGGFLWVSWSVLENPAIASDCYAVTIANRPEMP